MFRISISHFAVQTTALLSGLMMSAVVLAASSGNAVVVETPAQRIAVMDFGALDTLDYLQQGQRVIALPKDNIPEYLGKYNAANYKSTGGMKEPNIEFIRELKPDLIIIGGRQTRSLPQLSELAPIMQWKIDTDDYLVSYTHNIKQLAGLVGQKEATEVALNEIVQKISDVRMKAASSGDRAVVIMHNAGKLRPANHSSYAVIIHDVLGVGRADDTPQPQLAARAQERAANADQARSASPQPPQVDINEYFDVHHPDIIFVIDRSAAIKQGAADGALWESDAIKATPAYQNKKIIILTPDLWYLSGGGLESLSLQIDEVAAALD